MALRKHVTEVDAGWTSIEHGFNTFDIVVSAHDAEGNHRGPWTMAYPDRNTVAVRVTCPCTVVVIA